MQLWHPPHDRPHLLEWWRPLMLASVAARRERIYWPIHLDEFRLAGRVIRGGRPDIWIYEHHGNGGAICVDATGTTYKFIPTPRARGPGRFEPCEIRAAVWRARLPDVVEPIWYDEPPHRRDEWSGGPAVPRDPDEPDRLELPQASGGAGVVPSGGLGRVGGDRSAGPGDTGSGASGGVVCRGHLTIIEGGRGGPTGDHGA